MDQKYQKRIQQNYVTLLDDTNAVDLVPHLWMNEAISKNDKDRIEKHLARQEQNTEFYNTILKKGNHAYDSLIQAMTRTTQGHLAKLLVISEDEGRIESFTMSDLSSDRTVGEKDDSREQTEDSNKVQVKVVVFGFTCEPIQMSMSRLDNIVKIKEYVEIVCGIDVVEQALMHQNKLVSDEETIIKACGSTAEVLFSVVPKFVFPEPGQFSIEVVLFGEDTESKLCLDVSGSDDIKKVKAKLKLSHPQNVPYYQLYLMFKGKECKEGYSLTECGITEGCTIYCQVRKDYFPLRIRDTSPNAYFTLIVTASLKIEDLLCSISHTRDVSPTMCELFYRGKRLPAEQALLETDKFGNLSKTELELRFVHC